MAYEVKTIFCTTYEDGPLELHFIEEGSNSEKAFKDFIRSISSVSEEELSAIVKKKTFFGPGYYPGYEVKLTPQNTLDQLAKQKWFKGASYEMKNKEEQILF